MGLNVKINFDELYEIDSISDDMSSSSFTTTLQDDSKVPLGVKISSEGHHLMPDVYNLAFGPFDDKGQIDDEARLSHSDHSRVFSTIIFAGMNFLGEDPDKYLGIDGSNNARAYMYYRCIQNNYDYLSQYFHIYGVNYFVRILRKANDDDLVSPIDANNIIAVPRPIVKGERIPCNELYNYFIFNLKLNKE